MEIPQQTSVVSRVHGVAKTLISYVQRMREGLDAALKRIAFQRGQCGRELFDGESLDSGRINMT
jgi:hypothetical protein